ncbi:CoA transferase [Mangrovimicrobium sediminis]|uniref:CoA transferase n=1 Tax=Mangrovimicrobium sediminis TaxID=2562682 RepID=A0A4Z0LW28_9GAMM|nr:CoA transferase [Haliea sp. SAOS-164]TGD71356.1 CoA transferase [Haliea sp. SAOS-164]
MSALRGTKVLELAEGVAGEYCGKLLADFGAEVIKLERPGSGSPTRALGPFAAQGDDPERSGLFAFLNTNKYSVTVDLASDDGRETLRQLLGKVDAVIDDHAVDWLCEVGLDPERLEQDWPRLVVASITPFGSTLPEDRTYAQDLNVFHSSGWGYHTPSAPDASKPPLNAAGRFLPSYESGMEAALCIAASLYEQDDSGLGRFIDISMQQVLTARCDYVVAQMVAGEMAVGPERTAYDLAGPAGIFRCRDGYAYIWMSTPQHWDGLRQLLDDNAWMDEFPPNWLERGCTPERVALCRKHVAAWLLTQDKHEVAAQAQKLGLTLVAVNNGRDLQESPQYQHRGFFAEVEHPVQGKALYPTVPYRLSETPACIERPAPLLGEHSDEQLGALADASSGGAA